MTNDVDGSSGLKQLGVTPLGERLAEGLGPVDHLCGVVTQWKEPRKSMGGLQDYMVSFTLADPYTNCNVKVNMFHPSQESLPAIHNPGDIMICKDLTLILFNDRPMACTKRNTSSWVVFDGTTLAARKSSGIQFEVTKNDEDIARLIHTGSKKILKNSVSNSRPVLQTAELDVQKDYFNYIGEILARNDHGVDDRLSLLLTDYTPNPLPMVSNDQDYGYVEPSMLLQCTLWNENVGAYAKIDWGSDDEVPRYVFLLNCRAKVSKLGNLELGIHGDRDPRYPKVKKLEIDDPRLNALLTRKKEYMTKRGIKTDTKHAPSTLVVSSIRTSIRHRSRFPYTLIEDIFTEGQAQAFYRIRASIVQVRPNDIKTATRVWCEKCGLSSPTDAVKCVRCKQNISKMLYRFIFVLKDTRGSRLLALYYTLNQRLFPDIPIVRLEDHPDIASTIEDRFKILSSGNVSLDFLVESYEVEKTHDIQYRIVDTDFIFDGPTEE